MNTLRNIFKFLLLFQIAKGNKYFRQTPINLTSHSKIKVCSGSSYIQALATKETDFIFLQYQTVLPTLPI